MSYTRPCNCLRMRLSFLSDYLDIFSKTLATKEYKNVDDETDEEILDNLKTEHEANEILKEMFERGCWMQEVEY